MGIADDAVEVRAQGWRTLAALHGLIEAELERALASSVELSVVEYTVLDALSRQDGWHMRMQQLARAAALSPSATTRLVNRLEDRALISRVLCADDRRGIYTELTAIGRSLYERARPIHDETLERVLAEAEQQPELAPVVDGAARRSAAGRRGLRQTAGRDREASALTATADVHEPRDAEAVGEHAERVAPRRDLERLRSIVPPSASFCQ